MTRPVPLPAAALAAFLALAVPQGAHSMEYVADLSPLMTEQMAPISEFELKTPPKLTIEPDGIYLTGYDLKSLRDQWSTTPRFDLRALDELAGYDLESLKKQWSDQNSSKPKEQLSFRESTYQLAAWNGSYTAASGASHGFSMMH